MANGSTTQGYTPYEVFSIRYTSSLPSESNQCLNEAFKCKRTGAFIQHKVNEKIIHPILTASVLALLDRPSILCLFRSILPIFFKYGLLASVGCYLIRRSRFTSWLHLKRKGSERLLSIRSLFLLALLLARGSFHSLSFQI